MLVPNTSTSTSKLKLLVTFTYLVLVHYCSEEELHHKQVVSLPVSVALRSSVFF
jgi:hypothetical protein